MTNASGVVAPDDTTAVILAAQSDEGAFTSVVRWRQRTLTDRNGFITALVVRALGSGVLPADLHQARTRALDYLETCASSTLPGAFRFWPEAARPLWAPHLPDDADDTALIALELFRADRRPLDWLRRVALTTLMPFRVAAHEEAPVWAPPGVFRTWLVPGPCNPVDCIVNINVAALLAVAGLRHVGSYRAVTEMISRAVDWSQGRAERLAALAPFYPHGAELTCALRHAVGCGVTEFERPLHDVSRVMADGAVAEPETAVCCAAYGTPVWSAPALQAARRRLQG